MEKKITKSELRESLDKIYETIVSREFLRQKGLGNEIPFYIYDYPAEFELLVRNYIQTLTKKLKKNNSKINILEVDLYDLMINIIEDKGLLDKVIEIEKSKGSKFVEESLKPIIKPENFNEYIKKISKEADVLFLTGVGKIYPLVRSHTILNNLHHIIPETNLVMFFPGEYTKIDLKLFSKLKDDNYYRAFRLNTII